MTDYHDLLIEICTEELPPKRLSALEEAFFSSIKKQLQEAQLDFADIKPFSTPRRLAVLVYELAEQQPTQTIERKGPNVTQAYDAQGQLTPAGKGFLHSCGITQDQLSTIKTDKGECLHFIGEKPGLDVTSLIPEMIYTALKALPIPKPMRWGRNDFQFIRPVHSIIALYGQNIIPFKLFGLDSNRASLGHRQMSYEEIVIGFPEQYETELEQKGFVIASAKKRHYMIVNQIKNILENKFSEKTLAKLDPDLLDEVCALVEWPKTLLCQFDEKFLAVPQEALIASMQGHQKCFPITDQHNQLLPYFLTVSNLDSRDESEVIRGNECVMRARLSDAKFFYETDLKKSLESYLPKLDAIIYQEKLGSLADKVNRITKLAISFSDLLKIDIELVKRATKLCKLDLLSHMVGEFPELQGVMGKYYALHEGENSAVAAAIEEHYWPRFAEDKIPTAPVSIALALADRLDTIVGFFSIGLIPTGSKDPFALRRAASGFLKIIIENKLAIDLTDAILFSLHISTNELEKNLTQALQEFFMERFKTIAIDEKISVDVFNAAKHVVPNKIYYTSKLMNDIQQFKTHPDLPKLIQAHKRFNNFLSKVIPEKGFFTGDYNLFGHIEKKLCDKTSEIDTSITPLIEKLDFSAILLKLVEIAPIIDEFFENIEVMAEDLKIREGRLYLLDKLRKLFSRVADFSELQP